MLNFFLNLLFGCKHRNLSRPITPKTAKPLEHKRTYKVCLDCGKELPYDLGTMTLVKRKHSPAPVEKATEDPVEECVAVK